MKKWSKQFNIPLPECGQCGTCCNCASPSASYKILLEKASKGDEFARDFFSIFVPYNSIEEAQKTYPDIIERSIKSSKQKRKNIDDVVFYKCIYHSQDKQCLIYEDRPSLCRDFPGSPFVILSQNCSFYEWSKECKARYKQLETELDLLKECKKELNNMKYQYKCIQLNKIVKRLPDEYKFIALVPSMSLISPGKSWIKF